MQNKGVHKNVRFVQASKTKIVEPNKKQTERASFPLLDTSNGRECCWLSYSAKTMKPNQRSKFDFFSYHTLCCVHLTMDWIDVCLQTIVFSAEIQILYPTQSAPCFLNSKRYKTTVIIILYLRFVSSTKGIIIWTSKSRLWRRTSLDLREDDTSSFECQHVFIVY